MKKLLSLCLAIVMMVSLLACFTVNAVSVVGDYEYYYFSYANLIDGTNVKLEKMNAYPYPRPDNTGRLYPVNARFYADSGVLAVGSTEWDGDVNYDNNSGTYYFGAATAGQNASNTIDVYVKTAGTYTIWALVPYTDAPSQSNIALDPSDASFPKLNSGWKIAVNRGTEQAIGEETYVYDDKNDTVGNVQTVSRYCIAGRFPDPYVEYKNQYYWDKVTADFNAGKNTIAITSTGTSSRMSAMFVTNDNERDSSTFAYIGTYGVLSTTGTNASYDGQNIKYFADGQYHEDWVTDGFINLREYSDLDAPTVEIDEAGAKCTDNTIEFSWTQADPKREYVGKNMDDHIDNAWGTGYDSVSGEVSTFYADASGIYEVNIYESNKLIATITDGTTTYTYNARFTGSDYNFKVEAIDHFGNVATDTAIFRTTGPEDETPPTLSGGISVENAALSSTITWDEATDNTEVLGYEVYEDSMDPSNLIAFVETPNTSCTIPLLPHESKEVLVVAKDRVGLYSSELRTTVTSGMGTEHFLIRKEHFADMLTNPAQWRPYGGIITTTMIDELNCYRLTQGAAVSYARGNVVLSEVADAVSTARIYVDEPGKYTAFMHVEQNGYGFYLSINGKEVTDPLGSKAVTNSTGAMFDWVKADKTFDLKAGWNTIKIKSLSDDDEFSLLYITNSSAVKTNELTYQFNSSEEILDGKLNTGIYDDVKAPVFEPGELEASYNSENNDITLTWPSATDEAEIVGSFEMATAGFKGYKVSVNDKEIKDLNTTSLVLNEESLGRALVPGEVLNIKVEALDKFGNASVLKKTYEVSKLDVVSFTIENSAEEEIEFLSDIDTENGDTLQAKVVIRNISGDSEASVRIAIAIYDANNNLINGSYSDLAVPDDSNYGETVSITIDPSTDLSGCTIKAHLWDASNLSPVTSQWASKKIQ